MLDQDNIKHNTINTRVKQKPGQHVHPTSWVHKPWGKIPSTTCTVYGDPLARSSSSVVGKSTMDFHCISLVRMVTCWSMLPQKFMQVQNSNRSRIKRVQKITVIGMLTHINPFRGDSFWPFTEASWELLSLHTPIWRGDESLQHPAASAKSSVFTSPYWKTVFISKVIVCNMSNVSVIVSLILFMHNLCRIHKSRSRLRIPATIFILRSYEGKIMKNITM